MSNTIDCSRMSHAACAEPLPFANEAGPCPQPALPANQPEPPQPSHYECVSDCVSSLGVPQLVAGAAMGLGCAAPISVVCPIVVGASAGAIIGWCDGQCADDESSKGQ